MHYTVDYSGLSEQKKQDKAIADIIAYLGQDKFDAITVELKKYIADGAQLVHVQFQLSFVGIQGYPVTAWYEYCGGK